MPGTVVCSILRLRFPSTCFRILCVHWQASTRTRVSACRRGRSAVFRRLTTPSRRVLRTLLLCPARMNPPTSSPFQRRTSMTRQPLGVLHSGFFICGRCGEPGYCFEHCTLRLQLAALAREIDVFTTCIDAAPTALMRLAVASLQDPFRCGYAPVGAGKPPGLEVVAQDAAFTWSAPIGDLAAQVHAAFYQWPGTKLP